MSDDKKAIDQLHAQLQAQLEAVYASTSWKITAPLRFAGAIVIVTKACARQMLTSPRAFAMRIAAGCVRRAIPMVRGSDLLKRLAFRIRDRYPAVWERAVGPYRPGLPVPGNVSQAHPAAVTFDPPYAWNSAVSQAGHFKQMLTHELQQRQNNKSEHH
jgi:hypothetical protein